MYDTDSFSRKRFHILPSKHTAPEIHQISATIMPRSARSHRPAFTLWMGSPTRRDALRLFAGTLGVAAISPVRAATESKPKKGERGSKSAKGYELCLSQCLYDCTTPKAAMAKSRVECRVECKDECAVSREQL